MSASGESKADLVRELVADRENKNVDFKLMLDFSREKQKEAMAVDVISFANAEGGNIIVGVENRTRAIVGIEPLDRDRVLQSITERTDPPVGVVIDNVHVEDKLVMLIQIPRGKIPHRLRKDRRVYLRRDGINSEATPEETFRLYNERDYSAPVYLTEPEALHSSENGVFMLSGEKRPYRRIRKEDRLGHLAESLVFLPEFSDITPAPEFGGTKGCFLVSYPNVTAITHQEFVSQVRQSESQFQVLGRYFGLVEPAIFYWSISSDGWLCVGCGSDSLAKALDNGELGVISVVACGEYRGAEEQRSTLLVIGGYAKSRENGVTYVREPEVRSYLSSIPISAGWLRSLFAPFMDEERLPFNILSYELVHPRLRVWRPFNVSSRAIPIQGVIRLYKHTPEFAPLIGGAIANTNWFSSGLYSLETEWKGGNLQGDKDPADRFIAAIQKSHEVQGCPIQYLEECVVHLAPPAVFYDDIETGQIRSFRLPSIKDFEIRLRGYTLHVLGLNASPIERD